MLAAEARPLPASDVAAVLPGRMLLHAGHGGEGGAKGAAMGEKSDGQVIDKANQSTGSASSSKTKQVTRKEAPKKPSQQGK